MTKLTKVLIAIAILLAGIKGTITSLEVDKLRDKVDTLEQIVRVK